MECVNEYKEVCRDGVTTAVDSFCNDLIIVCVINWNGYCVLGALQKCEKRLLASACLAVRMEHLGCHNSHRSTDFLREGRAATLSPPYHFAVRRVRVFSFSLQCVRLLLTIFQEGAVNAFPSARRHASLVTNRFVARWKFGKVSAD